MSPFEEYLTAMKAEISELSAEIERLEQASSEKAKIDWDAECKVQARLEKVRKRIDDLIGIIR